MKHFRQKYISISRSFFAGLFCLTILFARQAVFLLHKCDHMNSGLVDFNPENNTAAYSLKKDTKNRSIRQDHCHSEKAGSSEKHDHHSCAICLVYEQLLQGATLQTLSVYSVNISNISQILPIHSPAPIPQCVLNVSLARGPPTHTHA